MDRQNFTSLINIIVEPEWTRFASRFDSVDANKHFYNPQWTRCDFAFATCCSLVVLFLALAYHYFYLSQYG